MFESYSVQPPVRAVAGQPDNIDILTQTFGIGFHAKDYGADFCGHANSRGTVYEGRKFPGFGPRLGVQIRVKSLRSCRGSSNHGEQEHQEDEVHPSGPLVCGRGGCKRFLRLSHRVPQGSIGALAGAPVYGALWGRGAHGQGRLESLHRGPATQTAGIRRRRGTRWRLATSGRAVTPGGVYPAPSPASAPSVTDARRTRTPATPESNQSNGPRHLPAGAACGRGVRRATPRAASPAAGQVFPGGGGVGG